MKENIKWLILGGCIIIAMIIYVRGTGYQAISPIEGMGQVVIYDRMTGERK